MDILSSKQFTHSHSPLQELLTPFKEIRIKVKRDDLLSVDHFPAFSGNKWRKLKYNLLEANSSQSTSLITFGGAYSNHIAALADAGHLFSIPTHGIIRGQEIIPLNTTLRKAVEKDMTLWPISREAYRQKEIPDSLFSMATNATHSMVLPEGGTNLLAIKGCQEIMDEIQDQNEGKIPDYVCACCGTGGTLTGLILGSNNSTKVLGFPVLKGNFLRNEINKWLQYSAPIQQSNWQLHSGYHFGGYAKHKPGLIEFINQFYRQHHIKLDPIYTGKLFFGVFDLAKKGFFKPGSTVVIYHSGGLQGIEGFNQRFGALLIS